MDFIFADDANQNKPSRIGMENAVLIAIGGVYVSSEEVGALEKDLSAYCTDRKIPTNEQFKWSPKRDSYFQKQFNDESRLDFFIHCLKIADRHKAKACVVIVDKHHRITPRTSPTHEHGLTTMFLERCQNILGNIHQDGIVIVSKPGGGKTENKRFLSDCLETIREGTNFVKMNNMPLGVVTAPNEQMRILQLADVVTSCVISRVSGENNYSPTVFPYVKAIFCNEDKRIGGIGLKIHPDFTYVNLYHWLLDDKLFWKYNCGNPLPIKKFPYFESSQESAYKVKPPNK
jgi:hypothetical protein